MITGGIEKQLLGRCAGLLHWLNQSQVTDILINGTTGFYVDVGKGLEKQEHPFKSPEQLLDLLERLLLPIGKRVDAATPYLDGRMMDGSRFHVILPPIALEGPMISIRKHHQANSLSLASFVDGDEKGILEGLVRNEANLLIVGGTGVGKTSLLGCLLNLVPENHRLLLIEETTELWVSHPHTLHLEARARSTDGRGEVTLRDLLRNALRMRPDRLVLGEVRGVEAFDLVQAMNTGHRGTMATLHANGALEGLKRLEALLLMAQPGLPLRVAREWVTSSVQSVVYLERRNGKRQVAEIIVINGMEGDAYRFSPVFKLSKGIQSRY